MTRLKQCAAFLMVVLMALAIAPASACTLPGSHGMRPSCCAGMQMDCARMMSMDGSCCQMRNRAPAVEAITPFRPAHDFVLLSFHSNAVDQSDSQQRAIAVSRRAIPTASPGLGTILRI